MLASAIAVGILSSWLLRGDLRRLATLQITWWPLLLAAVVLRLLSGFVPDSALVFALAFAATGIVAVRNIRAIPGVALLAAGAFMNAAVVALNGGMPVDPEALAAAEASKNPGLHVDLSDQTRLPVLADVIPVRLTHVVYSAGDLVLAVGGFVVPFRWLQRK